VCRKAQFLCHQAPRGRNSFFMEKQRIPGIRLSSIKLQVFDARKKAYARYQVARVKRLNKVIIRAGLKACDFILQRRKACQQHNGQVLPGRGAAHQATEI